MKIPYFSSIKLDDFVNKRIFVINPKKLIRGKVICEEIDNRKYYSIISKSNMEGKEGISEIPLYEKQLRYYSNSCLISKEKHLVSWFHLKECESGKFKKLEKLLN